MYQGSGNKGFAPGDILVALGLLSRIPVSVDPELAVTRAATATWAYPLVGAVLGGLAGLVGSILLELNLPSGMAAALALGVLVLLSGAMHEDGLADCADGLGGGHDRERRLEIMKDRRIWRGCAGDCPFGPMGRSWQPCPGRSVLANAGNRSGFAPADDSGDVRDAARPRGRLVGRRRHPSARLGTGSPGDWPCDRSSDPWRCRLSGPAHRLPCATAVVLAGTGTNRRADR